MVLAINRILRTLIALGVMTSALGSATQSIFRAAYAAPVPIVSVSSPAPAPIGTPASFNLSFSNTGVVAPTTGYGPYVDLFLPRGADGDIAPPNDGLSFVNATYLGFPVPTFYNELCATGSFEHPLTKLVTSCQVGQQVVILRLPFGSYTNQQPTINLTINTNISPLADPGVPLTLTAQSGFQFGSSATGQTPIVSTATNGSVTPYIFQMKKTYTSPEDETATGPNFPRKYNIGLEVAAGQTLSNAVVTDNLPNSIAYTPNTITSTPSTPTIVISSTPVISVAAAPNLLQSTLPNGSNVGFSFFVPYTDSAGQPVLSQLTGASRQAADDAAASALWQPRDPRDAGQVITSNLTISDHVLIERSLAIQKLSVANGKQVEYTLDVQVSDFFAFSTLRITDTLGDGLRFDSSFAPLLQVNGNAFTLPTLSMNATNVVTIPNYTPVSTLPNDGHKPSPLTSPMNS